jgi:RHS repeat-associated protein
VMWYPTTGVPISAYKVYDPFGVVTKSSSGAQSALGFQGQFTDATTGDVNMGARWYNPSGGSFRGRDTMFGSLSSPSTLNRYSYVSNNPLNSFDPNGREEFSVDLSTLSGFFGGDALGGITETLGAGISAPEIVSYEVANPSAGVYNYVANVSDGSSTIATIAPTGVNVSQPTTTVSSGYLAYTPNDATAAAAIVLIESGTPAPAIGQAINDAYNAISAAPTQEAILAVAATNAAATAAAAAALMAQETAANAAAQAAAAAATIQTQTASGPSEAPGMPDSLALVSQVPTVPGRSAPQGVVPTVAPSATTGYTASAAYLGFVKVNEGLVLSYYADSLGFCTVGYGTLIRRGACTKSEKKSTISEAKAEELLANKISDLSSSFTTSLANKGVQVTGLAQTWQDALFDVYFNNGRLPADTAARVKSGDFTGIVLSWDVAALSAQSQGRGLAFRWADRVNILYGDYSSPCKIGDLEGCPNRASIGPKK